MRSERQRMEVEKFTGMLNRLNNKEIKILLKDLKIYDADQIFIDLAERLIYRREMINMPTYMKCSNCGQKYYTAANIEITENKPCPVCGGETDIITKEEYEEDK